MQRTCGVLLHLTSLPSRFGIGDLGPEALRFAEFLARAGQKYWQVLPLGPVAARLGASPYSGFSAFAGNTLCVSPEELAREDLLKPEELESFVLPQTGRIDFAAAERGKNAMLRRAFDRARPGLENDAAFRAFIVDNASWLPDFALFAAAKEHFGGAAWPRWPEPLRLRREDALREYGARLHDAIVFHEFCQWLYFRQWGSFRSRLEKLGVRLMGDVPFYVTHDSADVWANSRLFKLDPTGEPACVAGVPPDYFSAEGQRWGNPVYDWAAMEREGYAWWVSRLRHNLGLFDVVRLDHFRGFAAYWEIAAGEKTAVRGRWVPGPGARLFDAVKRSAGGLPLLAENLGVITEDVEALRESLGLPGMKVLQFAFGPNSPESPDAPHNHEKNCVVYTGTHDNDTTRGWFRNEATAAMRRTFSRYVGRDIAEADAAREMIRLALMSPARLAVIPAQDLLNLGSEARMNTPGVAHGNWGWRAPAEGFGLADGGRALAERLRGLCELYGRAPSTVPEGPAGERPPAFSSPAC